MFTVLLSQKIVSITLTLNRGSWVDGRRIPGAVLLVAKDGQVVLQRAYGWAERWDYGGWSLR